MAGSIVKATGVVLIVNLVVKLLGFLRETFIAGAFGASNITDAYLSAYTLPYFLQAILGAALVTVMVPVLTRYLVVGKKEEAWHVASSVLNLTAIALTVCTILGIVLANVLVAILTPGFEGEQAALTATLARIMFPSVIFMGLGMVVTGILNANHRYGVAAFAPGFSNIIIIASVIAFGSTFGVKGLAVGTLISFLGTLVIQLPVLKKVGFRYHFVLDLKHPGVRQVIHDILPIVLGVAVNQIYFAINRIFASGLADGTISALNYANKVMMLPLGIFVAAVVAVIYPSLSEHSIKKEFKPMAQSLQKGLGLVSIIAIPAAVALIVLRVPIVELLFERGAFDSAATQATANALLFFVIGLWPMAMNMVLTRAFFALGGVKTPLIMGGWSILVNVALSFALYRLIPFGGGGLALANSVAAIVNMLLFLVWLRRPLPDLHGKDLLISNLKIFLASLIMGVALFFAWQGLTAIYTGSLLVQVCIMVVLGILVYAVAIFLLRVDEVKYLKEIISKRLKSSVDKTKA